MLNTRPWTSLRILSTQYVYVGRKNAALEVNRDEGNTLETLDFAFRLSAVHQPFIFPFLSLHLLRSTLRLFHWMVKLAHYVCKKYFFEHLPVSAEALDTFLLRNT